MAPSITVYTAEPSTEDAERLALALVLGTQTLVAGTSPANLLREP